MRMLFASTVPFTLDSLMRGQLKWISDRGHEVHVVSSPGPELYDVEKREGVVAHVIPMEREISLAADLQSLRSWVRLLREVRPDVTVVGTPKAGLLGGLAAARVHVPRRVYLLRGARFEGATGLRRATLRETERLSCACAHQVIAVSRSLADLAVAEGLVSAGKCATVGLGSSNGVDAVRFHPPSDVEKSRERERWALDSTDVAIAYVGRLTADKGLDLLQQALRYMEPSDLRRIVLLVAGPNEGAGFDSFHSDAVSVRMLGMVRDVPSLLRASDLLVLPTQREGFPNVVIEAAASGLPVVTTNATGAIDSVIQGETGFIVSKTDCRSLARAITTLAEDAALRRAMGLSARRRVEAEFTNEMVWEGMLAAYLGPPG